MPSLAYDDGFVWYLSGRLAADLIRFQATARAQPQPEGDAAAQRADLEVLYHRYLIDCKDPLPELAKVLGVSEMEKSAAESVGDTVNKMTSKVGRDQTLSLTHYFIHE